MSSEVRFQITQLEIDSAGNESQELDSIITADYSASNKFSSSIPNSNSYVSIPFGIINSTVLVRFTSDQVITLLINGTITIPNCLDLIIKANFQSIQVKNESGLSANISIQIYGE